MPAQEDFQTIFSSLLTASQRFLTAEESGQENKIRQINELLRLKQKEARLQLARSIGESAVSSISTSFLQSLQSVAGSASFGASAQQFGSKIASSMAKLMTKEMATSTQSTALAIADVFARLGVAVAQKTEQYRMAGAKRIAMMNAGRGIPEESSQRAFAARGGEYVRAIAEIRQGVAATVEDIEYFGELVSKLGTSYAEGNLEYAKYATAISYVLNLEKATVRELTQQAILSYGGTWEDVGTVIAGLTQATDIWGEELTTEHRTNLQTVSHIQMLTTMFNQVLAKVAPTSADMKGLVPLFTAAVHSMTYMGMRVNAFPEVFAEFVKLFAPSQLQNIKTSAEKGFFLSEWWHGTPASKLLEEAKERATKNGLPEQLWTMEMPALVNEHPEATEIMGGSALLGIANDMDAIGRNKTQMKLEKAGVTPQASIVLVELADRLAQLVQRRGMSITEAFKALSSNKDISELSKSLGLTPEQALQQAGIYAPKALSKGSELGIAAEKGVSTAVSWFDDYSKHQPEIVNREGKDFIGRALKAAFPNLIGGRPAVLGGKLPVFIQPNYPQLDIAKELSKLGPSASPTDGIPGVAPHSTLPANETKASSYIIDGFGVESSSLYATPPPGGPTKEMFEKYGKMEGVDPNLLYSMMNEESHFRPGQRSKAGAVGYAQFMPATWAEVAPNIQKLFPGQPLDPNNPEHAVAGMAYYMHKLLQRTGSTTAAIASYNAGPRAIAEGRMPAETQNYLTKVSQTYNALLRRGTFEG